MNVPPIMGSSGDGASDESLIGSVLCYPLHYSQPLLRMGMEIYMNELGQMTKMATVPMYGKNLLLQTQLTYDLET